jgi:solute carrier family 25 (mitochondrial adenine nucleotide translocator), member 4/5/6/31
LTITSEMRSEHWIAGGIVIGIAGSGFEILRRFGYVTACDWFFGGFHAGISKTISAPLGNLRAHLAIWAFFFSCLYNAVCAERVKCLLQMQSSIIAISNFKVEPYTGIFNCFARVIKEQGLSSLWRGNLSSIIRYFPTTAVNILFKDTLPNTFPFLRSEEMNFVSNLSSAALLGGISLLLTYPIDLANIRLCADVGENEFSGLCDCLATIADKGGARALYAGAWASIAGILLYRVALHAFFSLSFFLPLRNMDPPAQLLTQFALKQAATIAASVASYPLTTARHRLILQAGRAAPPYRGVLHCLAAVARAEGPAALFAGAGAAVTMSLASAALLVAYDLGTHLLTTTIDDPPFPGMPSGPAAAPPP